MFILLFLLPSLLSFPWRKMFHHFLISLNLINPHLPVLNLLPLVSLIPESSTMSLSHRNFAPSFVLLLLPNTASHPPAGLARQFLYSPSLQSTLGSFARYHYSFYSIIADLINNEFVSNPCSPLQYASPCPVFFLHPEGLEEDISQPLISFPLLPRARI